MIDKSNEPDTEYVVIIINCNSGKTAVKDYSDANIAGIALRSLQDIALTEVFNNDIDMFMKINKIVEQVEAKDPTMKIYADNKRSSRPLKSFKSILIQPDEGILGDALSANQKLITNRMIHGNQKAKDAVKYFEYITREELVPEMSTA